MTMRDGEKFDLPAPIVFHELQPKCYMRSAVNLTLLRIKDRRMPNYLTVTSVRRIELRPYDKRYPTRRVKRDFHGLIRRVHGTWRISAMRSLLLVSIIIGIPMQTGLGQTADRDSAKAPSLRADIPFDFENAIHRVYGTEQGLPSNWVQTVLQTSDGFLWVGTHNGLARFDGVNFISYQRPMLPVNDCRELLESRDGTLWIGTTGGLAKYRRGSPGSFEQIDELAQQSIRVIFEDSSDRIWVGTAQKTWRSNGSTFEPVVGAPNSVTSIIEDGSDLWLGSDDGLYEHSGLFRQIPLADNVPKSINNLQLLLDDGELLIGTNLGMVQIQNDRVQFLRPKFHHYINQIRKIGADTFVLADQIYRRNNDTYEVVNPIEPRFIASDRDGGVWISGIRDGKLHHYQPQPFAHMFPGDEIRAVHEDDQGTIWCGSHYYLHRIEHGRTTLFDVPVKLSPRCWYLQYWWFAG